ncbi:hypothetical protein HII31_06917 [Pseudocercospora fuligena]|uniref:Uncharacterized protein n=1 Tax=Pseudocercospora fuligena TaxID=685502 RepID=A0A8H6RJT3_9PEZI|nr:hypothetical protein HII31_06917 [Pseudocercospora fuligena]
MKTYDCVRRIRLADCAETGCGTFNIGARCYDGDTLRKSDAPHNLPLIEDQVALSQGQSALSSTSGAHKALGSPTSSATTSGSTYWPQRLCDAKDHPDDPTLGLYQKYDTVESVCADQGSIITCANKTETPCKKSRGGGSCCSTGGTALCCQVPGGLRLGFGNETWVKADGSVYATSAGNASEYGTLKEQGRESQYNPKNAGRMGSHIRASNSTTTDSASSTASTFMTVTTKANSSAPLASSTASDATQTKDSPDMARPCDPYRIIDPFCTSLAVQPAATSSASSIATRSGQSSLVEHIKQVGDEIVEVAKHVVDNITNSNHPRTAVRRDTFSYESEDYGPRSPDNTNLAHDNHGKGIGVKTSVTDTQGPAKPTCTPKPKAGVVARSGDNSVFERIKQIGNELIKIAKDAINGDRSATVTELEGLPPHMWNISCDHPLY